MKDEPKTVTSFSETRRDTPFRVMLLNVTHDNEHYGNIITYLRMKGIVPPCVDADTLRTEPRRCDAR